MFKSISNESIEIKVNVCGLVGAPTCLTAGVPDALKDYSAINPMLRLQKYTKLIIPFFIFLIMCSSVEACYLQPSMLLVTQTALFVLMLLDMYIFTACVTRTY